MARISITMYTANKKSNPNAPESETTWSSIKSGNNKHVISNVLLIDKILIKHDEN